MRTARQFNKRIEFYALTPVADGFGGSTISETYLSTSWANIKTFNIGSQYQKQATDFGVNERQGAIIITVRKRNDLDYSAIKQVAKYNGEKYIIKTNPTDVNMGHSYIQFIGVKESN